MTGKLKTKDIVTHFEKNPSDLSKTLEIILEKNPDLYAEHGIHAFDLQTRLYSKDYFEKEILLREIEKCKREKKPITYMIVDIDKFHDFNEKYGHVIGDEAIKVISETLRESFRTKERRPPERAVKGRRKYNTEFDSVIPIEKSYTGRVGGGEEFAVILPGCDENGAEIAANRLLDKVRNLKIKTGKNNYTNITISCGISQYEKGKPLKRLITEADSALYHSKNTGRDRTTRYSGIKK